MGLFVNKLDELLDDAFSDKGFLTFTYTAMLNAIILNTNATIPRENPVSHDNAEPNRFELLEFTSIPIATKQEITEKLANTIFATCETALPRNTNTRRTHEIKLRSADAPRPIIGTIAPTTKPKRSIICINDIAAAEIPDNPLTLANGRNNDATARILYVKQKEISHIRNKFGL